MLVFKITLLRAEGGCGRTGQAQACGPGHPGHPPAFPYQSLHFGTGAEPRDGSFPCLPVAKLLAALTWVFLQVFLPNLAV